MTKYNLEPFERFFKQDISPEELIEQLQHIYARYAEFLISNPDEICNNDREALFYLRMVSGVLNDVTKNSKS